MKLHATLRANEWWEYKLISILLVGYMTVLKSGRDILSVSPWILFMFLSLVAGASFVSMINDIFDIEEDLASNKKNRMAGISELKRWLITSVPVICGIAFCFFYAKDTLSLVLYLASWIAFSLYSIPPARLKTKGFWGVLADASGSQLFPTLLMVSFLSFKSGNTLDPFWFFAAGGWSFAYGLRGILWHQFHDLANDNKIGLNTWASRLRKTSLGWIAAGLLIVEIGSLMVMLFLFNSLLPLLAFFFYLLYIIIQIKLYQAKPIIFLSPPAGNFQIILQDFYMVFLPISVLLYGVMASPWRWTILAVHFLLFPKSILNVFFNTISFLRNTLRLKSSG